MYRILSPTAILGYGFPVSSFEKAMDLKLDLIAADAGSVDAGPYYLGSGQPYMGKTALKQDLEIMIKGAIQQKCKLIVGSAGFSGAKPQLDVNVEIVKDILTKLHATHVKLAIIPSDIDPSALLSIKNELKALGRMPALNNALIEESQIVGQMGIEPIVAALESDAQVIITGRTYDPAVFSADPIRMGYPMGPALHAAKILECGAIACEPGSGSDCLIAELQKDGKVMIYPLSEKRRATIKSIAAHTLYEKSRPDIFHLPGGLLNIQRTKFFQIDDQKAGFSGSKFTAEPYSIKIEGSAPVGNRMVSIIPVKNANQIDEKTPVYGRNGVNQECIKENEQELGIIVVTKAKDKEIAKDALSFLRSTLLHFGYPERISTAGNLAFPFSPSDIIHQKGDEFEALFIAGTRDPYFHKSWEEIKQSILEAFKNQHPHLAKETTIEFLSGNKQQPVALIETICNQQEQLQEIHQQVLQSIERYKDSSRPHFECLDMDLAYSWSLHHLTHDMDFIKSLFPISLFQLDSDNHWEKLTAKDVRYPEADALGEKPDFHKSEIQEKPIIEGNQRLTQLAKVIRSKNAGINEITYDIMFESPEDYQYAINSGKFSGQYLSKVLGFSIDQFIGCYRYDPVNAIKITIHRNGLSGSPGDHDVFGAQQHTNLLQLEI